MKVYESGPKSRSRMKKLCGLGLPLLLGVSGLPGWWQGSGRLLCDGNLHVLEPENITLGKGFVP